MEALKNYLLKYPRKGTIDLEVKDKGDASKRRSRIKNRVDNWEKDQKPSVSTGYDNKSKSAVGDEFKAAKNAYDDEYSLLDEEDDDYKKLKEAESGAAITDAEKQRFRDEYSKKSTQRFRKAVRKGDKKFYFSEEI